MIPAPPRLLSIPTPEEEARILGLMEPIAGALWEARQGLDPSLSRGLAGAALFLDRLSRRAGFESWKARSEDLLALAIGRVAEVPFPTLYGGYIGLGWCLAHLEAPRHTEGEEDPHAGMDEILLEHLERGPWSGEYDLISGLAGWGVYALERRHAPTGRRLLERILDHLEAMAIPRGPGLSWPTPPEFLPAWQAEVAPQGYLNLGLAHGVPGLLCLLAAMEASGIAPGRSDRLLRGGIAWLATQLQDPAQGTYLAGWCPLDLERPPWSPNRIAWCYGDLGASLALLNAARLVGDADCEALAVRMARLAATHPVAASGVKDVSLCHGSAGNLHLFHRLYRATGDPVFSGAARTYLRHTLDSHQPGTGFAGFLAFHPGAAGEALEDGKAYQADPSLLEGSAGAGLALLSLLEGADLSWDRFLLISTPLSPGGP